MARGVRASKGRMLFGRAKDMEVAQKKALGIAMRNDRAHKWHSGLVSRLKAEK